MESYWYEHWWRQERRERPSAHRLSAHQEARKLLLEHLNEEQRRSYSNCGWFFVWSKDGLRKYKVSHNRAGNVMLVGGASLVKCNHQGMRMRRGLQLCCQVEGAADLPVEDNVLAQKLILESGLEGERSFLRTANIF